MRIQVSEKPSFACRIIFSTTSETAHLPDFDGEKGSITTRYSGDEVTIYCSTGDGDLQLSELKNIAANGVRTALKLKRESISIAATEDNLFTLTEAIILGSYSFDQYKKEKSHSAEEFELFGLNLSMEVVNKAQIFSKATCYARSLVNSNASEITPAQLAEEAKKLSKLSKKIKITILDEKDIQREKLGLLNAVGASSNTPPRLIILEYIGNSEDPEKRAIVGKGITFDSGGLNLKPSGSIETMRMDMAGAAAVLGTMSAVAQLEPAVNIVAAIPAAHNAITSDSYFPGDVYRAYDGTTVEILNTDAEGRLILADAISYIVKNYSPTEIIDLATLTGAILICLGNSKAGLFTNSDTVAQKLAKSAEESGESVWRLPVEKEHSEALKSDLADLANISKSKKGAGSSVAAAFLQHFAKDTSWAHLDIAGVAWNDGEPKGVLSKFGTGWGVSLLLNYLLKSN